MLAITTFWYGEVRPSVRTVSLCIGYLHHMPDWERTSAMGYKF